MAATLRTSSMTVERFLLALDVYELWRRYYNHEEAVKLTTYLGSKEEYAFTDILDIYNILRKVFPPKETKMIITYIEERKGCFLPDFKAN
jgi:hypothetical protein